MCQFWVERPIVAEADEDEDERDFGGGDWEQVVCFPKEFAKYKNKIEMGAPVLVRVEKVFNGDGIMAKQVFRLDEI